MSLPRLLFLLALVVLCVIGYLSIDRDPFWWEWLVFIVAFCWAIFAPIIDRWIKARKNRW